GVEGERAAADVGGPGVGGVGESEDAGVAFVQCACAFDDANGHCGGVVGVDGTAGVGNDVGVVGGDAVEEGEHAAGGSGNGGGIEDNGGVIDGGAGGEKEGGGEIVGGGGAVDGDEGVVSVGAGVEAADTGDLGTLNGGCADMGGAGGGVNAE